MQTAAELWQTGDAEAVVPGTFSNASLAELVALEEGVPASDFHALPATSTWGDGESILAKVKETGVGRSSS